jgi:hypothetical protein
MSISFQKSNINQQKIAIKKFIAYNCLSKPIITLHDCAAFKPLN